MMKRIIFDLVLLGAIFYTPWWVATPLALVGVFVFPAYYEVFAFGLLVDLLFGTRYSALHGALGLLGAVALFFLGEFGKSIVRPSYTIR